MAEQILRMCLEAVGRLFTPEASAGARLIISDVAISLCVLRVSLGWVWMGQVGGCLRIIHLRRPSPLRRVCCQINYHGDETNHRALMRLRLFARSPSLRLNGWLPLAASEWREKACERATLGLIKLSFSPLTCGVVERAKFQQDVVNRFPSLTMYAGN
jgi:hypothetical protein